MICEALERGLNLGKGTEHMAEEEFVIPGVARNGEGAVDLPLEVARAQSRGAPAQVKVETPDEPGVIDVHFAMSTFDRIDLSFKKNGEPLAGETRFNFRIKIDPEHKDSTRRVLKEELSKVPASCSAFSFTMFGNLVVMDFGWMPLGWSERMLDDRSVDVHTRISMNLELARKIRDALNALPEV